MWQLKLSHFYALVAKLEQAGYLASTAEPQGERPARKVLRLTAAGATAFAHWRTAPVEDPDQLRLDFRARLYSMGGKIAIATTILHPARVTRLLIADSEGFIQIPLFMRKGGTLPFLGEAILALSARPGLIRMQLAAAFHDPKRFVTAELVERGRATLADPGVCQTMLSLSRTYDANDLRGSGLWPRLAAITCPALIVWGAEDQMFAARYAKDAEAAIPGARLVVIPRCGHFPQIEAADRFHGLLLGFLASGALS